MVNKSDYTHHARFLYIPAYFNVNTNQLEGANWFYNFLIDYVAVPVQESFNWVQSQIDPSHEPMWMIEIGEEIED